MTDKEQAKQLYSAGLQFNEIAKQLNVKAATVRKWKQRGKWPSHKHVTRKKSQNKKAVTKKCSDKMALIVAPLTEKRRLFCEIYVRNFNAAAAYKRAYPDCAMSTAHTEGPALLRNPHVRSYIEYLTAIKKQAIFADIDDLVELNMQIAFADYTDFADFGTEERPVMNKSGEPVMVETANGQYAMLTKKNNFIRLKNAGEIDGRMIAEVKASRAGISIKLRNQEYSMKWLSKYFEANPADRRKAEYDRQKQRLERERFEHQKKMDEESKW